MVEREYTKIAMILASILNPVLGNFQRFFTAIFAFLLLSSWVSWAEPLPQPSAIPVSKLQELFAPIVASSSRGARPKIEVETIDDSDVFIGILEEVTDQYLIVSNLRNTSGNQSKEKSIFYSKIRSISIISPSDLRRQKNIGGLFTVGGSYLGMLLGAASGDDLKTIVPLTLAGTSIGFLVGHYGSRPVPREYIVVQDGLSATVRRKHGILPVRVDWTKIDRKQPESHRELPKYLSPSPRAYRSESPQNPHTSALSTQRQGQSPNVL